jgi:hypothetical protein
MRGSTILRIFFGLILVAALFGVGVVIYNAGIAQGVATSGQLTGPEGQTLPNPYYYAPFYRPWGFGPLGIFFPILFVFLIFLGIRGLFFRSWRHHDYWRSRGWRDFEKRDIPPMVEEWHRKMHEAGEGSTSPQQ